MKKSYLLLQLFLLSITSLIAQTDANFSSAEPIGGFESITKFYQENLDLTKGEEKLLEDEVLYFEYLVDEKGQASFHVLSGIQSKKLTKKIELSSINLPRFKPATSDGQAIKSYYSFILKYEEKQYFRSAPYQDFQTFSFPETEDLEGIISADKLMEVYVGIPLNNFVGKIGDFTNLGAGMTVGMLFGRSKLRVGFDMSMYINKKTAPFVIDSPLQQHESLPTIFMGVAAATDLLVFPRGSLNLQGNLSYVQMNVTEKIDNKWDKFGGFSPGIRLNYIHKFWKPKARWYYGAPSLSTHAIQIHVGLAPMFMSDKQGNGLNIDFGICYRIIAQQIKGYRKKEQKETYRL